MRRWVPCGTWHRNLLNSIGNTTIYLNLASRHVGITQSRHYLFGLIQAQRKNMERMVEAVPGTNWQSLHHYTSDSPWDAFAVMDRIGTDVNSVIGNDPDTCMIVDESAFTKRGTKSVGVARQWNGRLGKVDNCQVGVYIALNCRQQVTLTDTRLFLPKEWTNSKRRCKQAGVPKDRYPHQKKTELALEMIKLAIARGSSHRWIGADAFYGDDPWFLRQLDQLGETFVVDVHNDQRIYVDDPKPDVPSRRSNRGRTPSRLKTRLRSEKVKDWVSKQPAEAWQRMVVRESTTGPIKIDVLHGLVWLWDGKEQQANQWPLIVRQEGKSKNKLKYSLSNAPVDTSIQRLAFMQGQRYFVERGLEDAKSTVGLADYQVRGWTGWHHHMAMVMLAMLFMLKTRIKYTDSCELLSCNDIRELLCHFLPRRVVTTDEVLRQMHVRHKKRKNAIQYYRKQKVKKSD